ncbi:MAG TPA: RDD family protein [Gemmataceae bacterium]|nr:RDD family protein [Gemmataceae bacterium]
MLHQVITSEKVPFNYRVAGLGARFLAWLLDLGLIVILMTMLAAVGGVWEQMRTGLGVAFILLATLVVQWGYFVGFEWLWHGQTPGKQVLGIRVIQWRGTAVSFTQAAVRNVLRVVDGLPLLAPDLPPMLYGVGFLAAACNRESRRLGDLAAGTLVVYVDHRPRPIRVIHATRADAPQRAALLRQRLEPLQRKQKQAILDLCLRRDQLRLRERARLFRAVTQFCRERLKVEPEEYESDEKFILQVAAALTAGPSFSPRALQGRR